MASSYLEEAMAEVAKSQIELASYQAEFGNFLVQFMHEIRAHLQIQSKQLKILEVQMGKMAKILSKEQQMSFPTLEEPRRVEVDAMELLELFAKEEGSTSLEMEEKRKEFKTNPKITFWGEMHEKLENQKMTPISELNKIIFELNEKLKEIMVKEAPKYLRKYASQKDYVLRQLLRHNFSFLGKDGGKNHHPICSWYSQAGL